MGFVGRVGTDDVEFGTAIVNGHVTAFADVMPVGEELGHEI